MLKHKRKRVYDKTYLDVTVVAQVFEDFTRGKKLAQISEDHDIRYETIQYWHSKWMMDHSYRPGSNYGKSRRKFTVDEEDAVCENIRNDFFAKNKGLTNRNLKNYLFRYWKSLDPRNRSHADPKKTFSNHFIQNFCRRNHLSFRKVRSKKRSTIDPEEVKLCRFQLDYAFSHYPSKRILNMDETSWHYCYGRAKVLAPKGTEQVPAQLPEDPRKKFTTLATIGADGAKNPPIFLARGSTEDVHKHFAGMQTPK